MERIFAEEADLEEEEAKPSPTKTRPWAEWVAEGDPPSASLGMGQYPHATKRQESNWIGWASEIRPQTLNHFSNFNLNWAPSTRRQRSIEPLWPSHLPFGTDFNVFGDSGGVRLGAFCG